jgi:hypothetical protein
MHCHVELCLPQLNLSTCLPGSGALSYLHSFNPSAHQIETYISLARLVIIYMTHGELGCPIQMAGIRYTDLQNWGRQCVTIPESIETA